MKQYYRLVTNTLVMDLYRTNWQICAWNLHFRKEKCFLLKDLSDLLYPNIENILYIQMDYSVWWSIQCLDIETLFTLFFREEFDRVNQYFKDRTEGFDDYYLCIYVCKMDASPIQPPSPSLPTNLSDQTIGNKGDNDVSILLGNGDGSFTSTTSDVVVGDAPSSVQYNSLTQILVLIWLYKKFFKLSCGIICFLFIR